MSEWDAAAVIAAEREALDQWSGGNPMGYMNRADPGVTFFDDIGATHRVDGLDACRTYVSTQLQGNVPEHRYEMVNPKVQVVGDVAVLTFLYHPRSMEGEPLTAWKASVVHRRTPDGPRMVHANWSMLKQG